MAMILVMASRNLDMILDTFPNSGYVQRQKMLWGNSGLYSRFILTSSLAAVALLPKRSEEHTSELQSLMRISYAVFCLKKKKNIQNKTMQKTQRKTTDID